MPFSPSGRGVRVKPASGKVAFILTPSSLQPINCKCKSTNYILKKNLVCEFVFDFGTFFTKESSSLIESGIARHTSPALMMIFLVDTDYAYS